MSRRASCAAGVVGLIVALAPPQGRAGATAASAGSQDFAFLVGDWRVQHRRLKPGSRDWVEFEGTCRNRELLAGAANMDEHELNAPNGAYRALGSARSMRSRPNGRSGGWTAAIPTARWTRR
jgi:hypothetical protein